MLLMLNGERTQRWREAEERGDDGSEHDKARKPLSSADTSRVSSRRVCNRRHRGEGLFRRGSRLLPL